MTGDLSLEYPTTHTCRMRRHFRPLEGVLIEDFDSFREEVVGAFGLTPKDNLWCKGGRVVQCPSLYSSHRVRAVGSKNVSSADGAELSYNTLIRSHQSKFLQRFASAHFHRTVRNNHRAHGKATRKSLTLSTDTHELIRRRLGKLVSHSPAKATATRLHLSKGKNEQRGP